MSALSPRSDDQYGHLRAFAASQKQTTVERLKQAITQLEAEGRPVNTFTIRSQLTRSRYYRATRCSTTSDRAWSNSCTRPVPNAMKLNDR